MININQGKNAEMKEKGAGEGALGHFLDKHRREVKNMVLTEFDEENIWR